MRKLTSCIDVDGDKQRERMGFSLLGKSRSYKILRAASYYTTMPPRDIYL